MAGVGGGSARCFGIWSLDGLHQPLPKASFCPNFELRKERVPNCIPVVVTTPHVYSLHDDLESGH